MANTTGYGYLLGPAPQFFDANGKPLVGGKLFVYIAGTTTTAVTYSDFNRTENTSPVILNYIGSCILIVPSANLYKIVLYDRKGNLLLTRDNVRVSIEYQIIYTNANKVESSDSTVDVTETTDTDTGIITYDLSIKGEIDRATEAEKGLADSIEAEKKRAEDAERALSESIADKAGTASPLMDGKASVGNSLKYAREDHVHPTDTSRASASHTHGSITNDGKIGTTADLAVVTGTSGAVTTADLTTASPTVPTGGTTTSLEFIDTVAQDSKGKISATKKAVPVDSTYSSTGTNPVNGNAIAAAIGGLDSNKTSTDGVNVQVKVTETDGKISAVNVTTDNTENKNNKVSTWQATPDNTHYPSEKLVKDGLDAKADADKVVAIADARIDRNGTDGWFKIASKAFNSNGIVLKFQWIVSALGSADNLQNVTFFLNMTIGFGSSGSNPYVGSFETSPIKKNSIGCDFKAIVNGTVGNATIELWAKVGSRYGSVAIRELQAGNFRGADAKGFLTYASYVPSDAGSSEEPTGNVSKKLTFVYVQEVIASPTKDNLVAMNANGLVKDSGLAKSSVESTISKAGSAIQGVKVNGTTLTPDANKVVTVPLATKSADGAMSSADKTKLDGIAAGAEVNQNAFSNVKVGSTTVAADTKTDTLEIVAGGATTITADSTNDKITISSTDKSVTAAANHYTPSTDSSAEKDASGGTATQLPTSSTGTLVQVVTGVKMDAKGHVTGVVSKGLWSPNTTYSNASLGQGYGTCDTEEATAAKMVTLSNYSLTTGGIVAVKFTYGLCASATMNINSRGAKKIFIDGAEVTDTTAKRVLAGDIAYFIYDGTQYHFLGSDNSKAEAGTASPLMDGKASVGNSLKYAREDHIHPTDANKLNADGSNATNEGVTAMMRKVPSGTGSLSDESSYFGDSDSDHEKIVRRPVLDLWNYIAPKVDNKIVDKLGSVGSEDKPIYLKNGVPKVCADGVPCSSVSYGGNVGYGIFVGGISNLAKNVRCYCTFLVSVSSEPDNILHTYIGTFTFRGKTLKSELRCLTGTPKDPLRIVVIYAVDGGTTENPTYSVGLYVIPARKTDKYSKYNLTRIAYSNFIWDVKSISVEAYDICDEASRNVFMSQTAMINDVATKSTADSNPIHIYYDDIICNNGTTAYTINISRLVIGKTYRFHIMKESQAKTYLCNYVNSGLGTVTIYYGDSSTGVTSGARFALNGSGTGTTSHTVTVARMSESQIYVIWGY